MVTTGGMTIMFSSLREAIIASFAESPRVPRVAGDVVTVLKLGSNPNSFAMMAAFSYSTTWLMLAKTPCLIRLRITSFGVACSSSARSLTMICGGIEIGPVGFSLTAVTRRSCGRGAGVAGRAGEVGRGVPPVLLPGLLTVFDECVGLAGRCCSEPVEGFGAG